MDVSTQIRSSVPAGTRLDFRGGNVPTGFLLEDGSSYSPQDYPRLFEIIGTTYGGDGILSFRVPDSRGRLDIGSGKAADLSDRIFGSKGGAELHNLAESELPIHGHAPSGSHTHGVSDPGHGHSVGLVGSGGGKQAFRNIYPDARIGTVNTNVGYTGVSLNLTAATYQSTGLSQNHNNMQPFVVANKIIKY